MSLTGVVEVLGGEKVLRQQIHTRLDLIALSRKGLPKEALVQLAHFLSCTIHEVADLLSVSERTLQRCILQQPLTRIVSEHILQLAEVATKGAEVFVDKAAFLAWLRHPNAALANHTPLNLLSSRFGAEMVLDELGRLEHVYRIAKTQYIHDLTGNQRKTMELSMNWSWSSGTSISTRCRGAWGRAHYGERIG